LEAARATGADVPVCLEGRARMVGGAGERLGPKLKLPRLHAVLVNPGVALDTGHVFAALALEPGERIDAGAHPTIASGMTSDELLAALALTRNDLEPAALPLAPVIAEALASLREDPACRLARMSGSGATVFGLYDDLSGAEGAASRIRGARPDWWIRATTLR
jgi:4-diphosphocytidyl-2-C-methyl-D-erythritol kinase